MPFHYDEIGHPEEVEEESFFISMTDIMVGMLFIFIMMLMYYALQVRIVVDAATSTRETKIRIIENIVKEVREKGVVVEQDAKNGIIRLKNNVLFGSGEAILSKKGETTLTVLAKAILNHTRCNAYINDEIASDEDCTRPLKDRHKIDAIYIEGHTDKVPINNSRFLDNWDLSVKRSTNTYRKMVESVPDLILLKNDHSSTGDAQSVISVAGYGSERPVDGESLEPNRRIDIRIIMKPISKDLLKPVKEIQTEIDKSTTGG